MTPGEIWDILVEHCKASPLERPDFEAAVLEHVMSVSGRLEYRFVGALGFGGKVWVKAGEAPYVNCYAEDLNDEREAMIRSANGALRTKSGIPLKEGVPLQVLKSKVVDGAQVTKCLLDQAVFYLRERVVSGKQVLELCGSDWYRPRIEMVVKMEDSMGREIVRSPEFTEAWAEKVLA